MSVVVVGSVAFDSIKTPYGGSDNVLGGSAVHFALASRLTATTRLVGVVGGDFPTDARNLLEKAEIDLEGLETVEDGETFRWSGEYSADWNDRETLSVDLNVFESFEPKLPTSYKSAPFVFLANGAPKTQESVLDQVDGKPFVMADSMNLWIQIAHGDLENLLKRIDGFVLNDEEAHLLTDDRNMIRAGRTIAEKYDLSLVIIKKGEHGALVFHNDDLYALPAYPLEGVVDPTGAGDSFAGGLVGSIARDGQVDTGSVKRGVAWGTVTASFCCEGFGTERIAALTDSECEARFNQYCNMIHLDRSSATLR